MRKIPILLLAAAAFLLVQTARAQTWKYYIDDREATREEVLRLPGDAVESISNSVEEAQLVMRVRLKPGAVIPDSLSVKAESGQAANTERGMKQEQAADAEQTADVERAADTEQAAAQERIREMVRGIYEQTTLLKEGDTAADFTASRYAGGEVSLAALRGKVVLLTFWATWCGPCLQELAPEELPEKILKRFAQEADFVFLPVAYTDTPESLAKFFAADKKGNGNYRYLEALTCMDPDKTIHGRFATKSIPRSFVIDREGRIVCGSLGAADGEVERVAEAIGKAL